MIDYNLLIEETIRTIQDAESVRFRYEITFITPDGEVKPLSMLYYTSERDPERAWFDGTQVKVMMMAGAFNQLAVYRNNIRARLAIYSIYESGESSRDELIGQHMYRAVFQEINSSFLQGEHVGRSNNDLDLTRSIEIDVQLIELAVEQIMHRTVGGTVHNMSMLDAFRYFLGTTKDISLPEEAEVKGVDISPLPDPKIWNDILIPHGTNITDLHNVITKNYYGMYPVGTQWYFYKNHWYVYPSVNLDGASHTGKMLTVLNLPSDRFNAVEKTHLVDEKTIKILCTGDNKFKDATASSHFNTGIGLRYISSELMDEGLGTYVDGKYVMKRSDTLSEFLIKNSTTGLTNAKFAKGVITNSLENSIGNVYLSTLKQVAVVWQNSVGELIRPGMAGIYIQEDTSGVKKYHCMVAKSYHEVLIVGSKIIDEKYSSQSVLVLIIGNEIN